MRFVHTGDWQIGKVFRRFAEKEAVLQQARLDVIETIGALAKAQGAGHVLVSGDLYDNEAPSPKTLLEPAERMKRCGHVRWHIIPGNHDPHRPKGVWDRLMDAGVPENVTLHLEAKPYEVGEAVVLPAPLLRKSDVRDLTDWMDRAPSSPSSIRIGMAHGSVVGFQSEGEANNPIDPSRPDRAQLDYLALGDWHRTISIGPKVSGTPEPDRFGSQTHGKALVVEIQGHGAPVSVSEHEIGRFCWLSQQEQLDDPSDIDAVDAKIRAVPDLSRTALRLILAGSLPLASRAELDRRLVALGAAMFWLEPDRDRLKARPTAADLEGIDFDGVLRVAADHLRAVAEDEGEGPSQRQQAADALMELYLTACPDAQSVRS